MKRITENDCIAEIKRVYRECGTITSNLFQKHGKIALTTVYKKCGSWNGALKTAGLYKEKTCDDIKNGIIQAMREMHERDGIVKFQKFRAECPGHLANIYKTFGTFRKALAAAGIRQKTLACKCTRQECIDEMECLFNRYGKITCQIMDEHGNMSTTVVTRIFGSWQNALEACGFKKRQGQRKFVSKEELDKEIFRLVREYGYISKPMMEKHSSYNPKIVNRIYGGFKKMYEALGVPFSKNGRIPTDQDLIDDFLRINKEYGCATQEIVEAESEYSITCYKNRFGSFNKLREKLGLPQQPCGVKGASHTANWIIKKCENFFHEKAKKEKTFPWLINPKTGKKLRIDAYFEKEKVGVEYNGPQHYKIDSMYAPNEKVLALRKQLDALKKKLCAEHGIKIVTISYRDKEDPNCIEKAFQ